MKFRDDPKFLAERCGRKKEIIETNRKQPSFLGHNTGLEIRDRNQISLLI